MTCSLATIWWPTEQGSCYGCPASQHSPFRKRRQLRITAAVLALPGSAFSGLAREEGPLEKQAQKNTSRHVWRGTLLNPAVPRAGDNNAISLAISPFILWASVLFFSPRTDPNGVQWCRTDTVEPEPEEISAGHHNRAPSSCGKYWRGSTASLLWQPQKSQCLWETRSSETIDVLLARGCLLAKGVLDVGVWVVL